MISWQSFTGTSSLASSSTLRLSIQSLCSYPTYCSLRSQVEPLESKPTTKIKLTSLTHKGRGHGVPHGGRDEDISGIQVPRQKYIPVSKAELLDAIVLMIFRSKQEEDTRQFLQLSSCLDSILHAEHKSILEEMRIDYSLTHSVEKEGTIGEDSERNVVAEGKESDSANYGEEETETGGNSMAINYGLDFRNLLLGFSTKYVKKNSSGQSRVALATRFQRAFMKLLNDAQFEELSARDLMLTSALNTDYLLTLPIYVDWKRASESNAIIFRRGYATERQKGLLIVEKLDYIQSKLLQGIFFIISKPLKKVGNWINEALQAAHQTQEVQVWTTRMRNWIKGLSVFQKSYFYDEQPFDNLFQVDELSNSDLPIWLAAQRAVTRYEGLLSSIGPRGRLLKKLLTWIGFIPPSPEVPSELYNDSAASEPYLRPIFLSRISLGDIWRPATRKYCENDLWKMLKTSVSILLSQSILQEPAFQELILLYTKDMDERETKDKAVIPSLELKIYERIPIPELPVIFPHKKLSFRIIDTVRLDVATVVGLLAYFINYKFENILSSPSAVLLDVIALSTLIIYMSRVVLGYKQTWDRYQLLVNKTLNEKTLASGFGSVHFLLDASEQQQYKEAILAYAVLFKAKSSQVSCRKGLGDECERFMYDVFKEKVEMPIDKAMDTLLRLGLVTETAIDGRIELQALPCSQAYDALKQRWDSLLD